MLALSSLVSQQHAAAGKQAHSVAPIARQEAVAAAGSAPPLTSTGAEKRVLFDSSFSHDGIGALESSAGLVSLQRFGGVCVRSLGEGAAFA